MTEKEDVNDIVLNVATCVKVELPERDVEHRVPTKKSGPPNIVVKFVSKQVRDSISKTKKKNRLNAASFGFQGSEPVYVNAHLCAENKVLLGKVIQVKKRKELEIRLVRRRQSIIA